MENSALVITVTLAGISKWPQGAVVLGKTTVSFLSTHFKNDDHESAHEEERVCHLSLVCAGVVEYSGVVLAVYLVKFGQFPTVAVHHGQIQWPKVFVKWHVYEIIIDVEEESFLVVLWGLDVGHPVESPGDDVHRLAILYSLGGQVLDRSGPLLLSTFDWSC